MSLARAGGTHCPTLAAGTCGFLPGNGLGSIRRMTPARRSLPGFRLLGALLLLLLSVCGLRAQPAATNRVLDLDGTNSFVELPPGIFTNLTEATVEGWVKWSSFGSYSRFFDFGKRGQSMAVYNLATANSLAFEISQSDYATMEQAVTPGFLIPGEWVHVAAVSGPSGMKLFANGVLVATHAGTNSFAAVGNGRNYLGQANTHDYVGPDGFGHGDALFRGQMSEIRLWKLARTEAQIQTNLFTRLTGTESGLAALYNFADPANPGRDATGHGYDGTLRGNAKTVPARLPTAAGLASSEGVLEMDGQTGVLELSHQFTNISDTFTIELRARPTLPRTMGDTGPYAGMSGQRYPLLPTQGTLGLGGNPHAGVGLSVGVNGVAVVEHADHYFPVVVETPWDAKDWVHVAVVYRDKTPSLFVNGALAATGPRSERIVHPGFANAQTRGGADLGLNAYGGQVDEIRVWDIARSEAQIRQDLSSRLTGQEPGLVGYWNFEDPANPGRDLSPGSHHGTIVGNARVVRARRDEAGGLQVLSVVSGIVTVPGGKPATNAVVVLSLEGREVVRGTTGANGSYLLLARDALEPAYDLSVSRDDGATAKRSGLLLKSGERLQIDLELVVPATLSGTLRDTSGQLRAAVMVQAMAADGDGEAKVAAMALTGADGSFRMRRIPPGTYRIRAQAPGQPAGAIPGSAGFVYFENGEAIELAPGAVKQGVAFALPPAAKAPTVAENSGPNRALQLDGQGSYVELPPNIFNDLTEATVEGWVKWSSLRRYSRFFDFGAVSKDFFMGNLEQSDTLIAHFYRPPFDAASVVRLAAPGLIQTGQWCHVAVVSGRTGARLYFNGTLVATDAYTGSFSASNNGDHNYLGHSNWTADQDLHGEMDEVRVWVTARTGVEIRENMFRRLTGAEPGLAGLWNFDDPQNPGRDATPHRFDGTLMSGANVVTQSLPEDLKQLPPLLSITGRVTDPDGRAAGGAGVAFRIGGATEDLQGGPPLAITTTDFAGAFSILHRGTIADWGRTFTLRATLDEFESGVVELDLSRPDQPVDLKLRDVSSISGQVLALNGRPLPSVIVQARPQNENTTDDYSGLRAEVFRLPGWDGRATLRDARTAVMTRIDPQVDFDLKLDGITGIDLGLNYQVQWSGILRVPRAGQYTFHLAVKDFGWLEIDQNKFIFVNRTNPNHTQLDQTERQGQLTLTAGDHPIQLLFLSFGAAGQVRHPDGIRLSWSSAEIPKEVIPASAFWRNPPATAIALSDENGVYRFPKLEPARYVLKAMGPDGFQIRDGGEEVEVVQGQPMPGVNFHLRPIKKGRWQNYTTLDGLGNNDVSAVFQAADGAMWFGTADGVSRFDGQQFTTLTREQGLPEGRITSIVQATDGAMWFGTPNGLVRCDTGSKSEIGNAPDFHHR